MSNSALEQAQEEAKADMTPMIDCVFLMIIFFICIDFKVLESKLPAYLPKDKGSQSFKVDPVEQLSIGIYADQKGTPVYEKGGPGIINPNSQRPYRYKLVDHKMHWVVGPKPVYDLQSLARELERIAKDPTSQVPDKDNPGRTKLMACVIEPHPGAVYDDVAKTADAAHQAGFKEINFGGGLGPSKKP